MKVKNILACFGILTLVFMLGSCDKTKPYTIITPPPLAHFVGDETQSYSVLSSTTPPYSIVIGTTDVSSQDRVVTYKVISKTGAVAGQEYTLTPAGAVTIPAGKSTATISLQGNTSYYPAGKIDTLQFTLSEPGIKIANFLDTLKLLVKGPCSDVDVNLSDMGGSYANSTDPDDPKYTVKVTNLEATSATTGTGIITNLWDGIGSVTINFDWSDANNITVTIPRQPTGINYAVGQPLSIRTSSGAVSTFSVCDQTITLTTDLIVEDYFGPGQPASYKSKYVMKVRR